jgi:hypothetical protein
MRHQTDNYSNADIEDKHVKTFLRWMALYVLTVIAFTLVCVYEAFALTTEDVEGRLESEIMNILDLVEHPSMDVEVRPAPASIDFSASNYLEMIHYKMIAALVIRASREGKPQNHYVDIFTAAWAREQVENKAKALQVIKEVVPCPNGFEIYPNTKICNEFATHQLTEENYYHAKLSVYQLSKRNQELEAKCGYGVPTEKACNDLGWSNGNIWKPDSATRPNQGVVLLQTKYCDGQGGPAISNFRIEDALGGQVANASFDICNKANGGRLHYRFSPEGKKLTGPVYVRYVFNGVEECRKVTNPANRED